MKSTVFVAFVGKLLLLERLEASFSPLELEASHEDKNATLLKNLKVKGQPPYLVCYDYSNFSGDQLILRDYAPYLEQYSFNDRVESCVVSGIWILYDGQSYNSNDFNGASLYTWGDQFTLTIDPVFRNRASSAKYAGPASGYRFDSLTLYQGPFFSGEEQFIYEDAVAISNSAVDSNANSAIVTGREAWTIYSRRYYLGDKVCIYPGDFDKGYPAFLHNSDVLFSGRVASVRRGCFSKNVFKAYVGVANVVLQGIPEKTKSQT